MDHNQMALHTLPGCTHPDGTNESGMLNVTDCATDAGCVVTEAQPNSFGAAFAQAGGGVWAAQFDVAGILFVFFSHLVLLPVANFSLPVYGFGV